MGLTEEQMQAKQDEYDFLQNQRKDMEQTSPIVVESQNTEYPLQYRDIPRNEGWFAERKRRINPQLLQPSPFNPMPVPGSPVAVPGEVQPSEPSSPVAPSEIGVTPPVEKPDSDYFSKDPSAAPATPVVEKERRWQDKDGTWHIIGPKGPGIEKGWRDTSTGEWYSKGEPTTPQWEQDKRIKSLLNNIHSKTGVNLERGAEKEIQSEENKVWEMWGRWADEWKASGQYPPDSDKGRGVFANNPNFIKQIAEARNRGTRQVASAVDLYKRGMSEIVPGQTLKFNEIRYPGGEGPPQRGMIEAKPGENIADPVTGIVYPGQRQKSAGESDKMSAEEIKARSQSIMAQVYARIAPKIAEYQAKADKMIKDTSVGKDGKPTVSNQDRASAQMVQSMFNVMQTDPKKAMEMWEATPFWSNFLSQEDFTVVERAFRNIGEHSKQNAPATPVAPTLVPGNTYPIPDSTSPRGPDGKYTRTKNVRFLGYDKSGKARVEDVREY